MSTLTPLTVILFSEGCKSAFFSFRPPYVLTCISEYWINLGKSAVFKDKKLIECMWRIYDDILKVWNFDDPLKVCMVYCPLPRTHHGRPLYFQLLSGDYMFPKMIKVVKDLASNAGSDQ